MRLVLVLASLLACSSTSASRGTSRIVGGHDISIEEAPYQVSLQYEDAHSCGGSIVAPNFIVTAAHCTDNKTEDLMSIRAGTSTREDGGQVIKVKKITNHPNFNYDNDAPDYDMAVLELETSLELGFQVAVISLPTQDQTWPTGTDALISGWGLTHEGDTSLPVNLQGATVQLVDQSSCVASYGRYITERTFCAGVDGGGVDSCQDDSGGPLQVNGVLAGIVSFGNGCGLPDYPGVYTNVSVVIDFIHKITSL